MKVALLAPVPPPHGGIAAWTMRMLNAQLENGWEITVVDEKTNRTDAYKRFDSLYSEVKRCFRIWGDLKNTLKDGDVKVVHSCIPATATAMLREYICACITKKRERKFIVHFRCTVPNMVKSKVARFMLKKLCDKSDLIITLNNKSNEFIDEFSKTPHKVIPNFILESEISNQADIDNKLSTAIYVGGVIKEKGAFNLIDLAKKNSDVLFRCFGAVAQDVLNYYNSLNITNVVFEGEQPRETVKKALTQADVFVFLTYFSGEGFSNALCEAMGAGLPCLVTDWAANADMIEQFGGMVVPVNDSQAACEAFEKMRSYEIRKEQSQFNLNKVRQQFVENVVIKQYTDVYEEVLK